MRNTLTIDPEVEQLLERETRRTSRGLKAVVNDALRVGLGMSSKPTQRVSRLKMEPHASGFQPGIDPDRLNQLFDEMEASEFARKLVS